MKVAFVPAVAPWFSGIQSVLSMPLNGKVTAKNVRELYEETYEGEKLVKILKGVPDLKDYENKHGWVVGGFQVHSDGDRAVVVVSTSCSRFLTRSTNFTCRVDWIISSRVPLRSASRISTSRWATTNTPASHWIRLTKTYHFAPGMHRHLLREHSPALGYIHRYHNTCTYQSKRGVCGAIRPKVSRIDG